MAAFTVALHHDRAIRAQAVRRLYASGGWWPGREEQAITDVLDSNLAIGRHMAGARKESCEPPNEAQGHTLVQKPLQRCAMSVWRSRSAA